MNKRTIIILVILLCLGAALSLYLAKKKTEQAISKGIQGTVIQKENDIVKYNDIDEIFISNPSGQFRLKKKDKVWYITEPVEMKADPEMAELLPYRLVMMQKDRDVEEKPKDLASYGLDNPDIKIEYHSTADNKMRKLFFGRRSPIQGSYYVMDPDRGAVVLIPFDDKFDFNGDLTFYRDRKIFSFKKEEVTILIIRLKDKTYEMHWDANSKVWTMAQPIEGLANSAEIGVILRRLKSQETYQFVPPDETSGDLGFDNPALSLTVGNEIKGAVTFLVGNPSPNGMRYGKIEGENLLFYVNNDFWFNQFAESLNNLVRTNAINLAPGRAEIIEFIVGDKTLRFKHVVGKKGLFVDSPEEPEVDRATFAHTVNMISQTPNAGYIGAHLSQNAAAYGLDTPVAKIHIKYYDRFKIADMNILFGKMDPSGKYIYVASTDDPHIRLIDKKVLDNISADPNNFIKK